MEVHYADEVYRADDGIRDPFRWSRFSNFRFVAIGLGLVLLLIYAAGQDRGATLAGEAVDTGAHVAGTAVRMTLEIDRAR